MLSGAHPACLQGLEELSVWERDQAGLLGPKGQSEELLLDPLDELISIRYEEKLAPHRTLQM